MDEVKGGSSEADSVGDVATGRCLRVAHFLGGKVEVIDLLFRTESGNEVLATVHELGVS